MNKWIRLVSTGLLGMLGACRPGGSQLLPNSADSTASFTPDGGRILVDSAPTGQIYLYDLAAKKVLWSLPAQPLAGVSFSPGGRFAILVEQRQLDSSADLSVIRLADGVKSGFTRHLEKLPTFPDGYYREFVTSLTAVSDDGAWVVLAYVNAPLAVYATADGRLLYQAEKQGARVAQVSIDPGDGRVVVQSTTTAGPRVEALTQSQGIWSASILAGEAALQASRRAAIVTSRGIEAWRGGELRLVVPLTQRAGERDVYAVYPSGEPCVEFSSDGAFAAVSTYDRFDVFDLKSGAKIFSHSEKDGWMKASDSGLVLRAEFVGRHLRAFLKTGNFVDVDLGIPAIVKTVSFGSLGSYGKNWLSEGSSWESNYEPLPGPGLRYLDIYEAKSGHQVYPLP